MTPTDDRTFDQAIGDAHAAMDELESAPTTHPGQEYLDAMEAREPERRALLAEYEERQAEARKAAVKAQAEERKLRAKHEGRTQR